MQNDYLGQTTDTILGQEFLTWLWFRSEMQVTNFIDAKNQSFSLTMEQRIVVQGGEGPSLETATVSGPMSELREARLGLKTGKKVTRALIFLEQDSINWQCTLKAADFSFSGLKTPKVDVQDDDEPDAIFLEKIYLLERAFSLVDAIYALFITLRVNPALWEKETQAIHEWIHQKAVA